MPVTPNAFHSICAANSTIRINLNITRIARRHGATWRECDFQCSYNTVDINYIDGEVLVLADEESMTYVLFPEYTIIPLNTEFKNACIMGTIMQKEFFYNCNNIPALLSEQDRLATLMKKSFLESCGEGAVFMPGDRYTAPHIFVPRYDVTIMYDNSDNVSKYEYIEDFSKLTKNCREKSIIYGIVDILSLRPKCYYYPNEYIMCYTIDSIRFTELINLVKYISRFPLLKEIRAINVPKNPKDVDKIAADILTSKYVLKL